MCRVLGQYHWAHKVIAKITLWDWPAHDVMQWCIEIFLRTYMIGKDIKVVDRQGPTTYCQQSKLMRFQSTSQQVKQAFLFTIEVNKCVQSKNKSNKDSSENQNSHTWHIIRHHHKPQTTIANLDCAHADKASIWTVAERKAIEEQLKITISKKGPSLSDSLPVANMQYFYQKQVQLVLFADCVIRDRHEIDSDPQNRITKRYFKREYRKFKPFC